MTAPARRTFFSRFASPERDGLHLPDAAPMRVHLYVVLIVILLGMIMTWPARAARPPLTISLVIIAEMFNSAIEATVDLVSPNYNPSPSSPKTSPRAPSSSRAFSHRRRKSDHAR